MAGWRLEYDIDVDETNSVVYERIYGVWRVDVAKSYLESYKEEVASIIDRPWAQTD